jgi:hypothetical protein
MLRYPVEINQILEKILLPSLLSKSKHSSQAGKEVNLYYIKKHNILEYSSACS